MNRLWTNLALVALVFLTVNVGADEEETREERLLVPSVFNIVRFPNDACDGDGNRNGTCYTAEECEDKSGTSSGTCASGYGVCCVFAQNCGGSTSENCTYFESTGNEVGTCNLEVCPCSDNICQLRLDFVSFTLTGPSADATVTQKGIFGQGNTGPTPYTAQSQCLTDTFQVTNSRGPNPPVICGVNTGEHMYVDAGSAGRCNDLLFTLGNTPIGVAALATRAFQIKITQYACDSELLAPDGCTQYFYGSLTGMVRTFNFNGGNGQHLANQNQAICVRRERGQCRICWATAVDTDFAVSGPTSTNIGIVSSQICGGYGVSGAAATGYDALIIGGAVDMAGNIVPNQVCGRNVGLVTMAGTTTATVCSDRTPFQIRFISDNVETSVEAGIADLGFQLSYIQSNPNNCA